MQKFFILSFALILTLFTPLRSFAFLEVPAHWQHEVLRTPHFDIVHNVNQRELALHYADRLEKAYQLLSKEFSILPPTTVVVINDKTDQTNGYATRIPYPHIMAYPVLPGPSDSLGEPGDWALEFLVHEYTHILNFEPATGIPGYLRPIFGNILAPNILLPQWWKEGLAVHMETRLSTGGRLRSIYQDASLRAWVDKNQLHEFDLAEINEMTPTWPKGMRPYLFGSLMWAGMYKEKGPQIVDQLNLAHSRRAPYFVEAPANHYLGTSYELQYFKALHDTQKRAKTQIELLRSQTLTPTEKSPWPQQFSTAPAISADGQYLAYIHTDKNDKRSLKIIQRGKTFFDGTAVGEADSDEDHIVGTHQDAPPSGTLQRVSWMHKSPQLVYDKVDFINRIERYSDLHIYDLSTKKTTRLTTGLRAREASPHPEDSHFAFVLLDGGQTHLAELDLAKKDHQILWQAPLMQRISHPVYLSRDQILFTLRNSQAQEHLMLYDRKLGQAKELTELGHHIKFPLVLTKQGLPPSLFFISAKNGTYNIYHSSDQKESQPLTHTLTALFSFARDPQTGDLYATEMTENGPQIVRINQENLQSSPVRLPQIEPLFADLYPTPEAQTDTPPLKTQSSEYSALGYLWPQYWIPFVSTSSTTGGMLLQASTSGHDPLKKHSYTASFLYDTLIQKGSLLGQYINQTTALPFLVGLSEENTYLGDVTNEIRDQSLQVAALPETWNIQEYSLLQVGWLYNRRSYVTREVKRSGPYFLWSYQDISMGGVQISPESGMSYYLGATAYLPGPDHIHHHQYQAGMSYYTDRFLPARHALMLRTNAVAIPEKISDVYGLQTDSLTFDSNETRPIFLMRGYQTGEFFGRNLINANIEYRFPLKDLYRGSGTDPLFIKRMHGAVVVDALALDGRVANLQKNLYERVNTSKNFWNYGGEVHLETTLGYVLPVTFVMGYYYAPEALEGARGTFRLNLQISGL